MTDGFDDQLVGELEPASGAVVFTGWSPGPAGVSGLTLADGASELVVDHAVPTTLVSLVLDVVDDMTVSALDLLLGGSARRVLDSVGTTRRVVWPLDDAGPLRARRGSWPDPRPVLGRLAVLRSEVERLDLPEPMRAVGLIELANLTADAPRALRLSPSAGVLGRHGLDLLAAVDAGWFDDPGQESARLVSLTLQRAAKALSSHDDLLARDALDLARRWEPDRPGARDGSMRDAMRDAAPSRMRMAAPRAMAAAAGEVAELATAPAPSALPGLPVAVIPPLDLTVRTATLHEGHLDVEVVGPVDPASVWLRAFRSVEGPVLLGIAPFERAGFGAARARALLPADIPPEKIAVDVTLEPDAPWRSAVLHSVERAVALGRRATRAERSNDRVASWERWQECAEEWERSGDAERAQSARAYSEGVPDRRGSDRRRTTQRPFTIDRLQRSG